MSGFIEGENRQQATMFPEQLDDYITEDNSVRVIDEPNSSISREAIHLVNVTIQI